MKIGYQTNWISQCTLTLIILCFSSTLRAATSVTQYGITWTFSADKTIGQYANGDYYVVGPVTIVNITPASTLISGRTMNGSMVNPIASPFAKNGLDSTLAGGGYDASLNAARPGGKDLSASNPLVLAAGSSLVSSITVPTAGARPQLSDAAVLTVVAAAPAAGSFRPPYCGTNKQHYWNKSSLNYSILKSLSPVTNTPSLSSVESSFARPWIEVDTQYSGREWHPSNNQPMYGRDLMVALGDGLLSLHLNYSNAQKELLYIRLVQYGIDVYGAAVSGGNWQANGGHDCGRKAPLLLAGLALNDSNITAYANKETHNIFQEDLQTFYVSANDVGKTVNDTYISLDRQRLTYTTAMIGLPEWGIEHAAEGKNDGSNWSTIYRDVNYPGYCKHALAMQLTTGAKTAWNWPAFFDFADRARAVGANNLDSFTLNMWNSYRSLGATQWAVKAPVPTPAYIPIAGTTLHMGFTANVSVGTGGNGGISVTASGGAVNATYASGSGTPELTYNLSRPIGASETISVSYVQPQNGLEATSDGQDVASTTTTIAAINYSTFSGSSSAIPPSNAKTSISISK